jgi:hypothetical protein
MAFCIRNGERMAGQPRGSRGFSLPIVMIMTVVASYSASRLEVSAQYRAHREREEELLFRGAAYVKAIKSFYAAETDAAKKRLPGSLDELVKDPRAQNRRHLRVLYKDPMTGQDFKVLRRPEGIVAVASTSGAAPLRRVEFADDLTLTEGAKSYREWVFEAKVETAAARPGGMPVGPTPGRPVTPISPMPKK